MLLCGGTMRMPIKLRGRPGTFLGPAQHTPLGTTPRSAERAAVRSHLHPDHLGPGCPAQGDPGDFSPRPQITLDRGHYHLHAEAPPPVTADQGSRKRGSRASRADFQSLSPSLLLCLLGACHKRALGAVPTRWGWQMAAKQGCCVITSLLRPGLA